MNRVLRVLIVDDSAYIRKVVKQMLSRSPFIEVVGTARDGAEALELVEQLSPDVVTLDLMMAGMDGLTFLREQMARRPVPVVVVSIANEGSEAVLQALDAGAVDFIQKPTALATEKVFQIGDELIEKVKAAAEAPLMRVQPPIVPIAASGVEPSPNALDVDIVVLGISTGGPHALKYLIPQLPADFPVPIAVVIHMPVGYTELFAQKIDELSPLNVVEAQQGSPVVPGSVLIAPAGRHLLFQRQERGTVLAHLDVRPIDTPHRPSVDVLFRSAAEAYGDRVLGIVMTGMGADGQQGAAWIKAQGGHIWTEAEASCVVYGMPRAVDEAHLSDYSVPLDQMAAALVRGIAWLKS
ncbi:MAG TPA: chemotaxis-specific protein-glutamate methyltransferase CheB [Herpetosiphonaceae bacterium]